ncbi:Permease of the drug/metabolite transporter (DMT) superfamily [Paraburkholderia fungorum]|uniref:Permease of the drug/metabolite transporter (DMT) superfamily n=1 Tax=Paraburkholderia fungorum TaxID=134537 RepID=A0A1H1HWM4_9BURK|nr:aromatic amino acid DMT transporter YddG [Paraburkholderia fungorum]SDR29882.1 Permease of the drug/metabolite transporter (DMT) superfamily [Paraburkholderia fungorum]
MDQGKKATLIGLVAVLLWSSIVGLMRGVSEGLGATAGAAMIYTVASVMLFFTVGFPDLRKFPRPYLIWGSLLFVTYELCLSLSIGYADSGRQAVEVGMVNYLWPTFTLIAAILFNGQRSNLLIFPGFVLSLIGIGWVLGGDQGFDVAEMLANVKANPLSFGLAFTGALIWAGYCTVTARHAKGSNGVTLFFMLTAAALWIKYAINGGGAMDFSPHTVIYLFLAASAIGFGYAAWNVGILHGNVTVLAGASYLIPVLSSVLAAKLLNAPLPFAFWKGAIMVCTGSILCWIATRELRPEPVFE